MPLGVELGPFVGVHGNELLVLGGLGLDLAGGALFRRGLLVKGLPFAVFVSAGNDGTGAVREIGRIANGYGWKAVAEALIVRGTVTDADLAGAGELGEAMAAGLAMGIF